ncbi:hypothetical protein [Methanosphaera sp.]|uniref:hypothetical protein n=1 Tax=Methanosphaera sp. TaxID=2666342 RepID=UPI002E77CFCE|nr:hypothetical protein [Methanosphaera sp.]
MIMKIIADNYGQISAELILLLSTIILIVLTTAYYTTNTLNDITNHTQEVIEKGRENILSQL